MATAAPDRADVSIKVIEDDLSCNICYNLLREPKDLDCPHVFCLQCLHEWVGKQPTVECPECRHVTIAPEGELVNLKTNFRLKKVIEKYAEQSGNQKGLPICPNHEGENQHFFCATCGVTVCHNCLVLEHERPRHEIKELKAIAKTKKAEVKAKVGGVDKKVKDLKVAQKKLGEMERNLQAAKTEATENVKKHVKEIQSEAETRGNEMIVSIEASYQERIDAVKKTQQHTTDAATRLHNLRTATQNVVDTAADHVFVKQHPSLVDKMNKLCMTEQEMPSPDLATLQFNPGSGPVTASWFGKVVVGGHRKCELKLIHEFGQFQKAQGVAVTQSGLLAVVDADAGEVIIYRDMNGEYKQQFNLGSSSRTPDRKITEPYNVAVTFGGKFLLAHERWTVKIFSSSGRYEKTLTDVGDTITTTPDDLIVTGTTATGIITVHQSGGELIRKHQVDCKFMQGIVSNGKQIAFTDSDSNSIHVIDFVTGQSVWTVDMVMPLGICYEPKTNSLLVAGGMTLGECVIEQYCSTTGHLISCLASGLCAPYAMTVTQDSKLVVADCKTVKIYDIQIQ